MIELIDNISQTIVTLMTTIAAWLLFYKSRKQAYFLLACFYGTFMLGSLYWTVYQLLTNYTPQIFYVSDLAWIASFLFLLTLVISIATPEERQFRHPAAWLSPMIGTGLMLFFYQWGDFVINTLWCAMTSATGWFSINGFFYARRQGGRARDRQALHIAILFFIVMEYCLWTASCFWVSDTYTNPYFWFDFLLDVGLLALLPAMRKAVDE